MGLYRVEKDGITFYVQPEQVAAYQRSGWNVYRQVEEKVTEAISASQDGIEHGIVTKEVVANG